MELICFGIYLFVHHFEFWKKCIVFVFAVVIYFCKGQEGEEGKGEKRWRHEEESGMKTLDPAAETDSLNGALASVWGVWHTRPHPTVTHRGGQGSSTRGAGGWGGWGDVQTEQDFLIIHDKCNRTQEALLSTI